MTVGLEATGKIISAVLFQFQNSPSAFHSGVIIRSTPQNNVPIEARPDGVKSAASCEDESDLKRIARFCTDDRATSCAMLLGNDS